MYSPQHFQEDRAELQQELIRAHPLGLLIVGGAGRAGGVTADTIPFIFYPDEGACGVLRCHVARANPLWLALAAAGECLVVFQGPDAYVSPGWYASKAETHKVVPTWNYSMVQVRGMARVMDEALWLRRQLDDLTAQQEGRMPAPWRIADAPPDFVAATMKAIVGIEIAVTAIAGKWKVSQNRSEADRHGVVEGMLAQNPPATAMAALVGGCPADIKAA